MNPNGSSFKSAALTLKRMKTNGELPYMSKLGSAQQYNEIDDIIKMYEAETSALIRKSIFSVQKASTGLPYVRSRCKYVEDEEMDSIESCELQHCRLRTDIYVKFSVGKRRQDERFYALIDELRLDWKETKKEVISIKDTMIQGFIALIVAIIGVYVSYLLLNVNGFL